MDQDEISEKMKKVYGELLGKDRDLWPGDFINFGYWRDIDISCAPTIEDRVHSQEELYRQVLKCLQIASNDRVVEVGSGLGRGAEIAMTEFAPQEVHGVDLVFSQVERSRKENARTIEKFSGRLSYVQGSAENLPFRSFCIDKIFSVEAIQHFPSVDRFIAEAARVLRRSGRLVVTSDFSPTSDIDVNDWNEFFGHEYGFVQAHCITDLTRALEAHGFIEIEATAIGEQVFPGLSAWSRNIEGRFRNSAERYLSGYKNGLWDYYLVSAILDSI